MATAPLGTCLRIRSAPSQLRVAPDDFTGLPQRERHQADRNQPQQDLTQRLISHCSQCPRGVGALTGRCAPGELQRQPADQEVYNAVIDQPHAGKCLQGRAVAGLFNLAAVTGFHRKGPRYSTSSLASRNTHTRRALKRVTPYSNRRAFARLASGLRTAFRHGLTSPHLPVRGLTAAASCPRNGNRHRCSRERRRGPKTAITTRRSEEHTSELQSCQYLV